MNMAEGEETTAMKLARKTKDTKSATKERERVFDGASVVSVVDGA